MKKRHYFIPKLRIDNEVNNLLESVSSLQTFAKIVGKVDSKYRSFINRQRLALLLSSVLTTGAMASSYAIAYSVIPDVISASASSAAALVGLLFTGGLHRWQKKIRPGFIEKLTSDEAIKNLFDECDTKDSTESRRRKICDHIKKMKIFSKDLSDLKILDSADMARLSYVLDKEIPSCRTNPL